ncbi:MAG: hypothetical protein ACQEQ4_10480 [Fibrobacterota bacterium]
MKQFFFILCIIGIFCTLLGEETDTARFSIDVKDMDVRDAIRMISKGYDLNIALEREVQGSITMHLSDIPAREGLKTITDSYGWTLTKEENVYRIGLPRDVTSGQISMADGKITANIQGMDVEECIEEFSRITRVSIVPDRDLSGTVSAKLYDIPVRQALESIFEGNGFSVDFFGDVYRITSAEEGARPSGRGGSQAGKFHVRVEDRNLTMDVVNAELKAVIERIAVESDIEMVIYGNLGEMVNAKLNSIPLAEGLALILGGTRYTFVEKDGIILIGDRNTASPSGQTLTTTHLVHLRHIKADQIPSLLPHNIPSQNIQVVKEQNALLITGTSEDIVTTRRFLSSIDIPTAQVAIKVFVVEYSRDLGEDFGFSLSGSSSGEPQDNSFSYPDMEINLGGERAQNIIAKTFSGADFVTNLPDNFNASLRLLETHKRAKVLAEPSLTVLNGHTANIDVGRTSYYKITGGTSENPTHNFRPINSGIKVAITPWISEGGQITMELSPEISNMTGLNSEGYPDISRRSISTTVRIDNKKTLVLGGLLRGEDLEENRSLPWIGRFLGRIPIIGILFQSRYRMENQSNLVIYVTPTVIETGDYVSIPSELDRINKQNNTANPVTIDSLITRGYRNDTTAPIVDTLSTEPMLRNEPIEDSIHSEDFEEIAPTTPADSVKESSEQ